MRRVKEEILHADLIWLMFDAQVFDAGSVAAFWDVFFPGEVVPTEHTTVVVNKVDAATPPPFDGISLSVKTGQGMEALRDHVAARLAVPYADAFSARRHHLSSLESVLSSLNRSSEMVGGGSLELAAEELKIAQEALSVMTGEVTQDNLLSEIFQRFCIGK